MTRLRSTRLLLAIGSGIAMALAFPNYNLVPLAWVSLCLLLIAALGARPFEAALCGFLHGIIFYPMALPWIYTVMRMYGNLDAPTAAGVLGLMAVAGALFPAVFCLGVRFVGKSSVGRACVLAPFLWVVLEFARTRLPIIGFPWNLLGYAASGPVALRQIAAWTGIYGLTFLVAAYNALLACAILSPTKRARVAAVATTAMLVLLATLGSLLVPRETPHHVAHLVQTNFPQSEHYPPDWLDAHAAEMDELEKISVDAARKSPGLIVWPEVPAPFALQDQKFAARAARIARDSGQDFLVGVVDWKLGPLGNWKAGNSAVLLDPSGKRIFTYDKVHLVPFGEYVPLRRWIKFAGRLTADISDFTPGNVYRVGTLPEGRFGTFICYEAIFPDEMRRFALGGAELLVNISNDGWFGRSAAPAQHLMMARVRAVENRRWLLRATNNGFTVSVDPYGRFVARIAPDIRGELDAPYDFRSDLTVYARFGDWWAWLCVFVSVVLMAAGARRSRQSKLGSTS